MSMQCEIVTQERTVYSREVDAVNLPSKGGRMGVLPNHMVMLAALDFGEVIVRAGGDVQRAQRAREEAEQAMREGVPEEAERYAQIEAALKRAQLRIQVGRRRSTGRRRRTMPTGRGPQEREEPAEEVD